MSDEPLRERFRELRGREQHAAPDFRGTLAAARARRGNRRRRAWLSVLVTVVAAVIALALLYPEPQSPPTPWTTGHWAAPSDVLLELPGSRLLRELPSIGTGTHPPTAPRRTRSIRRNLG